MGKITYFDTEGTERYVKTGKSVKIMRAARERWRKANAEKHNERNKKWRTDNPEKQHASEKRWYKANPEIARARNIRHKHRWRTKLKENAPELINAVFLKELRIQQKDACAYCFAPLFNGGELDHVTPVSKDGRHSKNNLVWACVPCNRKKSNKLNWFVINPANNLQATCQN